MAPPFVHDDLESRISRRARIIAVTVFVADFAVLAMNHKLDFCDFLLFELIIEQVKILKE